MSESEEDNLIVIDFKTAREHRDFNALLKEIRERPPLDIELDITLKHVRFITAGSGGGDPAKDRVSILLSELSGMHTRMFAAIRLTRSQWETIKKNVDPHFAAMAEFKARKKEE